MNRDEVKKIVAVISATYPNFNMANATATVDAWAFVLEEYDYNLISKGLKSYIVGSGSNFPPSISALIDWSTRNLVAFPNEMEAWAKVSKALRNGIYGAKEEFDKLDPILQKAVGSADNLHHWATTEGENVESVLQSNFIKTYRVVLGRAQEESKLPDRVKLAMQEALQIGENK